MTKAQLEIFWTSRAGFEALWEFVEQELDRAYKDGKADGAEYFCRGCYEPEYGDPE